MMSATGVGLRRESASYFFFFENGHNNASLYKRFAPEKARRLAAKLEVHYTPKRGSWLNMAENGKDDRSGQVPRYEVFPSQASF